MGTIPGGLFLGRILQNGLELERLGGAMSCGPHRLPGGGCYSKDMAVGGAKHRRRTAFLVSCWRTIVGLRVRKPTEEAVTTIGLEVTEFSHDGGPGSRGGKRGCGVSGETEVKGGRKEASRILPEPPGW